MRIKVSQRIWIPVMVLLLAGWVCCDSRAQSGNQGTLTITVQDKTGGMVPGAKLVLKDTGTNDVRNGSTLSVAPTVFLH
jgi:hypothetical protein